jgi:nucleolar GTP-binding protein
MPEDPFKGFHHIPPIDEVLESAYSKANKRADSITDKREGIFLVKRQEIKRIQVLYEYMEEFLDGIVKSVPDLSTLSPFYYELAQILVNNDLLKQKLGRISGVIKVLDRLEREHVRAIPRLYSASSINYKRKQAFGRLKSVVDKLGSDLEFLATARKKLRSLPVINLTIPAIVIAGYPNVGKSSFVNNLCGSKIQVAAYPFTTKEVIIGLHDKGMEKFQFIDTPGVLDRPMAARNQIEMQAITAIRFLANIIVFMFDPTPNCGFPIEEQLDLLNEVKTTFPSIDRVILITKIDLATPAEIDTIKVRLESVGEKTIVTYSATTRENEAQFLAVIKEKTRSFVPKYSITT